MSSNKYARWVGLAAVATAALSSACASSTSEPSGSTEEDISVGSKPWDDQAEADWSKWVQAIGEARASGKCTSVNRCLNNPEINFLKGTGGDINVFADCADLPVELRAYFAVKTGRPYQYVSAISADGDDERYGTNIKPRKFRDTRDFATLQSLLSGISSDVHSGMFRMAGGVEGGDTYPIDVTRDVLKPGVVFYDPNGHVLIVYKVEADGTVRMMDGHPDNSLTHGILSEKFAVGGKSQGGGFRKFRPLSFNGSTFTRTTNDRLAGSKFALSAAAQYGRGRGYFDWVRDRLSNGAPMDPIANFNELTSQLCADLSDRADAVSKASGLANTGPGPVPANIYGASGDWETFSTPSRDARFKASFRGLTGFIDETRSWVEQKSPKVKWAGSAADLGKKYKDLWSSFSTTCKISYKNSAGGARSLTIADIEPRLFQMSFDPYHCVELRWGAQDGELSTCPTRTSAAFVERYQDERRQRNAIDRQYGDPTPFSFGPETPEDVSVTAKLQAF